MICLEPKYKIPKIMSEVATLGFAFLILEWTILLGIFYIPSQKKLPDDSGRLSHMKLNFIDRNDIAAVKKTVFFVLFCLLFFVLHFLC